MNTSEIESVVRAFIIEHFLSGRADALTSEGSLLGKAIDSTGLIEFVMFLQERFGITVEDDEVVPENFESVKSVTTYVERKLQTKV
ncbi:MAG TPA: acyl carrier protein [Candidatus Acidoferrum sp.]|jgi:acyl carrier protein